MPLASSGDPGPPSFSWVLWWAVQKQHSQPLLPNLNYAVHPNALTREAGTMTSIIAANISNGDEKNIKYCFFSLGCFMFSSQLQYSAVRYENQVNRPTLSPYATNVATQCHTYLVLVMSWKNCN